MTEGNLRPLSSVSTTKTTTTIADITATNNINKSKNSNTKQIYNKKTKKSSRTPFEFDIVQWNAHSLRKDSKLNFIKGLKSSVIAIQEIWRNSGLISRHFQTLNIVTRQTKEGGGTATILNTFPEYRILKTIQINKDTNLLKINLKNNYMWFSNVYLNKGETSQVQKLFGKIQKNVPMAEMSQLLLIGDFNIDAKAKKDNTLILLTKICKQLGLRIELPDKPTRKEATLDFIIFGKNITAKHNHVITAPSDHRAIRWTMEINFPTRVKQLKIPSRETAEIITRQLLNNKEITSAAIFLDELVQYRLENHKRLKKLVKHKPHDHHLFEKLLAIDDPATTEEVVNNHWKEFWEDTEKQRFSKESKMAYRDLKNILKYHLFGEKRDGGIINQILMEDGEIIDNPNEVNESLAKTIEEIQVDNKWGYLAKEEFPLLPPLSKKEVKQLIKRLSTHKAITLDGLSDILFQKDNRNRTAEIFQDLWSIPLHKISGIKCSLTSRLVPLNKVFPKIPNRKQMRPILICSPLQKLLEARFLLKLLDYLENRLTPCQTGFIPKMGIQVNLNRAIQRIKVRTENKQNMYGLFIDFANAYNSVPHTLLFQKLRQKGCLSMQEIDYLEALYTNYRIRIGKRTIRFNKGVAQGSILSPALFNIFIEDLVEKIARELNVSIEDILLYADDLLVLCKSQDQVRNCIKIIEEWSTENGMELNKGKSGIVVFAPRRAKKIPFMKVETQYAKNGKTKTREWVSTGKVIAEIPIVAKYKYLGTYLDSKLTMNTQLTHIRQKSDFLFFQLYPYLSNATADARKDMWKTMVAPLFNAILILTYYERSKTPNWNMLRLLIGTFKKFMMIPKNTSTSLVAEMMDLNFEELVQVNAVNSEEKWEARKERRTPELVHREERHNYLKGIPNSWCTILKQQCKVCPLCKKFIRNEFHMQAYHNIEIFNYKKVWDTIKEIRVKMKEQKQKKERTSTKDVQRTIYLEYWNHV